MCGIDDGRRTSRGSVQIRLGSVFEHEQAIRNAIAQYVFQRLRDGQGRFACPHDEDAFVPLQVKDQVADAEQVAIKHLSCTTSTGLHEPSDSRVGVSGLQSVLNDLHGCFAQSDVPMAGQYVAVAKVHFGLCTHSRSSRVFGSCDRRRLPPGPVPRRCVAIGCIWPCAHCGSCRS